MCGINGITGTDKGLVKRMNSAINYRGPDNEAIYSDSKVTLGHVRLATIDLSPSGDQPMSTKDKKIVITYNGEIYNYADIKEELRKKGHVFTSTSDTEVILASYKEWGVECVKKFNGMWALCLYDKKKNILFCSRDRIGKKPFYYSTENKQLIFSSELKGLLQNKKLQARKQINNTALQLYFSLGFIPAPLTIYQGINKLQAGHNLVYNLRTKKCTITKYWDLPAYKPSHDKKALISEGRTLLSDAVRIRMRADVPVGAFLSGGLDSSTVVGQMVNYTNISKLHTFSIGFSGPYDESHYVQIVKDAFGTQHHHQYFHQEDFDRLLRRFANVYDEPFADYSGFPTYVLCELARKNVTVALSGDGGDELFAGYHTHKVGARMELLRKLPIALRKLGTKIPAKKNLDSATNAYTLKKAFELSLRGKEEYLSALLGKDALVTPAAVQWEEKTFSEALAKSGGSLAEALRVHDLLHNTLPDNFLVKVDRASMQHALEVRCPFLDYRFLEFSQRIPTHWKIDAWQTKKFMRELVKDIVPEAIIQRKKQGFTPPLEQWIHQVAYKGRLDAALKTIQRLDPEIAAQYEDTFMREKHRLYTSYIIRLYLFQLWWERWMH